MNIEILKALVEFVGYVRLASRDSDVENAAEILEQVLWSEIEAAEHQMHLTDGQTYCQQSVQPTETTGR